jgi:hypothetical protein
MTTLTIKIPASSKLLYGSILLIEESKTARSVGWEALLLQISFVLERVCAVAAAYSHISTLIQPSCTVMRNEVASATGPVSHFLRPERFKIRAG